jgi:hypothetical protein
VSELEKCIGDLVRLMEARISSDDFGIVIPDSHMVVPQWVVDRAKVDERFAIAIGMPLLYKETEHGND